MHAHAGVARAAVVVALLLAGGARGADPFVLRGPGVDPDDFAITTFASGLPNPTSMQRLADGSLLVLTNAGGGLFWSVTRGELVRLVDGDGDGVADGSPQVLYTGLPAIATSVRIAGELVFVAAQESPLERIQILRLGATPSSALTAVGSMDFTIPAPDSHKHTALAVRPVPGSPGVSELYFEFGEKDNLGTDPTQAVGGGLLAGVAGADAIDPGAIYRVVVTDSGSSVSVAAFEKIAEGTRNPAGLAFHPTTGDLWFEDNAANDPADFEEALGADELNRIAAADLGGAVEDFGFPADFVQYRVGGATTGTSIQPIAAWQPIPDPFTGAESEGPSEIAFAPPDFPWHLRGGVFVGFHGRFSLAGVANEENPVVWTNPATGRYFHFIGQDEPAIGHPNGLLADQDALYVADMASSGDVNSGVATGVIYKIRALPKPVPALGLAPLGLLAAALVGAARGRAAAARAQAATRVPARPRSTA